MSRRRAAGPAGIADHGSQKCSLQKARPEPVLRYFSNARAREGSENRMPGIAVVGGHNVSSRDFVMG